jgi:hypothetical protein
MLMFWIRCIVFVSDPRCGVRNSVSCVVCWCDAIYPRPPVLTMITSVPCCTGLYVRYSVGEVNGRAVCRMCKVVNVDLHGKSYKLLESGENCTVRLSLLCGGQVSIRCVCVCVMSLA